ncbi:MAG TPA: hypothetical protein VLX28_24640 [Thermoanaerobaculia bacterium]|nr:hypothetical protein [Thermoanaerobaculia bacterium]
MQQVGLYRSSLVLALVAGAVLSVAAFAADTAGSGVTFANKSNHHITLYARYGEGSCESKPNGQTVSVEPGQSASLDSGASTACFCLQVPDRRVCPSGWVEVKAGGTRNLM